MKPLQHSVALNETSMRVNLLHKALQVLGYPVDKAEVASHKAGASTLKQVRAFQAKMNLHINESLLLDNDTYDAMVEKIREKKLTTAKNSFLVSGTVYGGSGAVIKQQHLIAFDVDLKGAAIYRQVGTLQDILKNVGFEYLGETVSDAKGLYIVKFYGFQYARAERKKADVVVFAIEDDNIITGRSRMVNSEDYSNKGEVRNLNVIITKSGGKTEYEILMGDLNPFLKESKVKLIDLAKSNDQVLFCAGELDEDATKIQIAVDAEVLLSGDKRRKLSHELLYGIGREKIQLDWAVLYKKTNDELNTAITNAVKANIIKAFNQDEVGSFLNLLHESASSFVLSNKPTNQTISLNEVLSVSLPAAEQQTAFVNAVRNFKSAAPAAEQIDYKKFWNEYLPNDPAFKNNPQLISNLLFSQQLTVLTGGHVPLMNELQVNRQLNTPTQLLELDANAWKDIFTKTGIPDFIKADTEDERVQIYTGQIQTVLNAAYPTQKIGIMLKNQQLPVQDTGTVKGITTFLTKNQQFDISSSRIYDFEKEIQAASPDNYGNVSTELKRVQRIFQVSPTPDVMSVLMENNLDSAYAITSIPKKSFIKMYSGALGGDQMAEAVYQRSAYISTQAAEQSAKMYGLSHGATPDYVFSGADHSDLMNTLQKNVPNYSELFGSPDICQCDDCRSVYSAAAYFVDLLRFLWRGAKNDNGKSPLDMFSLRRPDLLYLPLTCENTNTIIPYIDLVNEVMEYYTYHGTLDKNAAYDTGETTSDELRANPQNFEPEAYRILKNTAYPFSLPYHQPLDVIRTYSDFLKTERFDVMVTMQKDFTQSTTRAIESEILRISEEEYVVLTGKKFDDTNDTRQLYEYFGFTIAADIEKMAGTGIADGIHEFLRRSGMQYTDLVELIKTTFINPNQTIVDFLEQLFLNSTMNASTIYAKLQQINAGTLIPASDADIMAALNPAGITSPDFVTWVQAHMAGFNEVITLYQSQSMCDLNTTYLRTVGNIYAGVTSSGISNDTWSKIHRFIRLWRKLGWAIHEVDLMLAAIGESDITTDTISKLSSTVLLNKELKSPLNQLATLWGNIDTYGDKSLYKKLFLNRAVQRIDPAFQPGPFGDFLTDTSLKLVDHVPAILAAFRMSEDDLHSILGIATVIDTGIPRPLDLTTDILNISNLSIIYRYTVLAKALKLKVPDFCLLITLFNSAPFSNWDMQLKQFVSISPASTYDFYELAASIKTAGFKAAVLQYIFTGLLPADSTLGLNTNKAKQAARAIRDVFNAIEQNYPDIPSTPLTTDILSGDLSLSFNPNAVAQLIGIIQSSQSFIVITDPGLPITIPVSLAANYSYDASTGKLTSFGIMPDADRVALKALAGATDNFSGAVDSLYTLSKTLAVGSPTYTVMTDANLGVVIPESLSPKYTYTKASGRLTCTGIMSDKEKNAFGLLPGINGNFTGAVNALYTMPEDFIKANFSGIFTNMNAAIATLLNHPSQPSEATLDEKLTLVYNGYLPLLKQKLHEDAITQHIAALIGLSEEATAVIIKNDLNSFISSLAQQGFSAEYFSDATFTTSVLTRVDESIYFDWGTGSPDPLVPADNFSVRWQTYLSAPSSGDYTLVVDVTEADESFKLYLDGALILEKPAANVQTSWEVIATLNASQMVQLTLEYAEVSQKAGVKLSWKTATSAEEIVPPSAAFPANVIDDFISDATIYLRASKFIVGFKLNELELNHFETFSADFANIDFKAITPAHWIRINGYVQLRNAVPQSQAALVDLFAAANLTNPVPLVSDLINILCLVSAWDINTVTYLVNTYFALSANDFKNEIALLKLNDAIRFVSNTGISAQTLAQWAIPETDFDLLNATADLVKITVKAKYEEEDWLNLAGGLSNKIRENQKQALISYLLTKPELIAWGVTDADGLFEYFLIDVQMGSCMDTSRIVQANSSVQMFVSRCLLNLESDRTTGVEIGVSPGSIDADRWEWMKYYRVWEVNRQIFLYPENWLEPEWRDDRSPFFNDMVSELIQNDITSTSVETAFRNYLAKLNDVANLEVWGTYQENDDNNQLKLLHVFARTHNAPYQFYYRTWDKYMKWSAWDKVQIDVRSVDDGDNSGMHLIPIVWKKRLFLFWTEFIQKHESSDSKNKDGSSPSFVDISNQPPSAVQPINYWEVRLAWTEYANNKWTPKQLSKEFLKVNDTPPKNLTYHTAIESGTSALTISLRNLYDEFIGGYYLSDIQSKIVILNYSVYDDSSAYSYQNFFMKHEKTGQLVFKGNTFLKASIDHKLIYSSQFFDFETALDYPFFYNDVRRTYFVRPINVSIIEYVRNPGWYGPIIINVIDESPSIPHYTGVGPDDYFPPQDFTYPLPGGIIDSGGFTMTNALHESSINPQNAAQPLMFAKSAMVNPKVSNTLSETKVLGISKIEKSFGGIQYINGYYGGFRQTAKGMEFHTFHHPFSSQFVTNMNQSAVPIKGLQDSDTDIGSDDGATFVNNYQPNTTYVPQPADFATRTYYKENVCFDVYGANSLYNWELFFHAPLYIATRLSKNGQYEEAMQWFHYIFDPTTDQLPLAGQSVTSRYWNVLPFKTTPSQDLEEWFKSLLPNSNPSSEDLSIGEWRDNPFKPHLIARNRPVAYMKNVVIKYVQNLIDWGDSLFRMDTMETVNEALQIYVIANHILGQRPQFVPKRGDVAPQTYDSLKDKWDDFSNALVQMENIFPFSSAIPVSSGSSTTSLLGIGSALYFCIPSNDQLLGFWDTVADRLFKIRHCMDIDGIERHLALFSPPIDPGMLINAAAQGLSLGSILADLSSPPPIYRFTYLVQKANDFCAEVKSLGGTLLSVLEKKDNEELGRMRASNETSILELMTAIKERQLLDANANKEVLLKTRAISEFKLHHYNALLSSTDITVPASPTIDSNLNADSALPPDTTIPAPPGKKEIV